MGSLPRIRKRVLEEVVSFRAERGTKAMIGELKKKEISVPEMIRASLKKKLARIKDKN